MVQRVFVKKGHGLKQHGTRVLFRERSFVFVLRVKISFDYCSVRFPFSFTLCNPLCFAGTVSDRIFVLDAHAVGWLFVARSVPRVLRTGAKAVLLDTEAALVLFGYRDVLVPSHSLPEVIVRLALAVNIIGGTGA